MSNEQIYKNYGKSNEPSEIYGYKNKSGQYDEVLHSVLMNFGTKTGF